MGKACPRREDLCGLIGQVISTETCAFVTVPGLSPVPAVPAQAVCARVTKNTSTNCWETTRTLSAMANTARTKTPGLSSDPTAHHCTSLAELVEMQAGWSLAYDFQ